MIQFTAAVWPDILAQSTAAGRATVLAAKNPDTIEFVDAADAVIRTVQVGAWAVGAAQGGYYPAIPGSFTDGAAGSGTPVLAIFKAGATEIFRCSCGTAAGNFYRLAANIVANVPIRRGPLQIAFGPPPSPSVAVPVNTSAPTILPGVAYVGTELGGSVGVWANSPASYTYQWLRNGSPIAGATNPTYSTVEADRGAAIIKRVFGVNAAGTSSPADSAPVYVFGFAGLNDPQIIYRGTPIDLNDYVVGGVPPYSGFAIDSGSWTGVSVDPATGLLTASASAATGLTGSLTLGVDDSGTDLGAYLGTLAHDGPATPEQIALYLPITGALPSGATASVEYSTDGSMWYDAHPLYRIVPAYSNTPATVAEAFAGCIFDLTPGTEYQVRVTVSDGSSSTVQTLTHTTRALPAAAGAATITIPAGSTAAQIQTAINAASPGDVIEIEAGTYVLSAQVQITVSGTEAAPIYIRGASRAGTILSAATGRVLYLVGASHLVIENMTLQGSGVDSGTASSSIGIQSWDSALTQRITVRNVTMTGVDRAVIFPALAEQALVYDCTFTGNNLWNTSFLENNSTWNDDGIMLAGSGNCAFNNTMAGFGDAFAVNAGGTNVGVHFYRNRVEFTCDDGIEADYGVRNLSFYDNRVQNSMTFISCDPLYQGPFFAFRNVSINTGRAPYKFNNSQAGMLVYNNTVVRQLGYGSGDTWPWVQFNNGALRAWGYRNNILVCKGGAGGKMMAMEAGSNNPIDFTNNGWYPDGAFWWSTSGPSSSSLAGIKAAMTATNPVFSGSTQRHENDLIAEADPFTTDVTLGATYDVQVTTEYEPALQDGSVLLNAGVAIPGITDGFSGAAPDIGAIITGRSTPTVGDRS